MNNSKQTDWIKKIIGIEPGAGLMRQTKEVIEAYNLDFELMDFLQTMPPYVYLVPAIALLGFDASPAIAATCLIAFAPAVRLTNLGIRQVPVEQLKVGRK